MFYFICQNHKIVDMLHKLIEKIVLYFCIENCVHT